ncbi:MAG TPA: MATE family efflux transporter [Thermoanaerobaculia bacterium]|nr:MATE family efflux transporter [Thermoanaerobaculia bacterium]
MGTVDVSYRRILEIAGPVLITNFSYTLMGVLDTAMVGRLGVPALAAVGLANMVAFSVLSFFWGLMSGVNTLTAQAFGARDRDAVGRVFFQGLYLALASGGVLLATMPLVKAILRWVDPSPEVAAMAAQYMDIRLYGGISIVLLWAADNFYRGLGRTRIMMWCGMAQLVLNCGFNWALIFGELGAPEMGVAGAALGTVLAQIVIALFLLGTILVFGPARREFLPSLRWGWARRRSPATPPASAPREARVWRLQPPLFRALVRLSLPIGVQTCLEMGGVTVFTAVVARIGDAELAATNAVIQAWSVAFMGALALAVGATTLVGQCVGAGELAQTRVVVRRVTWLGYAFTVAVGAVYVLAPARLMALFVTADELPRLLPFARPLFAVVVACLVFDLKFNILSGALRGAGDTTYSMLVNVGSAWLVFVPALLLVTPRWGLVGAWSCFILHVFVIALLLELRVRGSRWLRPPVQARTSPARTAPGKRLLAEGGDAA